MTGSRLAVSLQELQERVDALGPATSDDQSVTWDGRVLNSKAAVLAFLDELADAARAGRRIGPEF